MADIINPELFYDVPASPSGLFSDVFNSITTTTPIPPASLNIIRTPQNSGITDFTIINPYIHYSSIGNKIIEINPSAYLVIAPILFNKYNITQRRDAFTNTFISAEQYITSPR